MHTSHCQTSQTSQTSPTSPASRTSAVRRIGVGTALFVAVTAPLAFAGNANASGGHGGGAVGSRGTCRGGGTFELKAKHDDGAIEVEYEVDTNRVGQVWAVRLTDNGATVFSGHATTTRPSGSFSLRKIIANRAGADAIRATATLGARNCAGAVTV